jgi:hypothetical protein
MLAALLLNEPYPGGVPKGYDEEKADRYLKTLREEHFERQARKPLPETKEALSKVTYKLPSDLAQIELPGETAALGERVDDDELAFLLIIAEL